MKIACRKRLAVLRSRLTDGKLQNMKVEQIHFLI
jgi:hypothetical protein